MPQVLYETPTNRVIQQDDGSIVVVPVGLGPGPPDALAAPPPVAPAAFEPVVPRALPPGLGAPIVNPGPLPPAPQQAPAIAPAKPEVPVAVPRQPRPQPAGPPQNGPAPGAPDATAAEAAAYSDQQAAIDEASAIAGARAEELKRVAQERKDVAAGIEAERLAQQQKDEARSIELEKKYTDAVDASAKFAATPADKWGGADTSRKAIALIGVALSGFGSALMGQQRNPALDVLEAEFSRNIQKHMAQGEALERGASTQAGIADRFNSMSQSRQGQFQLRLANAWKGFEDQTAATMAKYAAPEVIANGHQLIAQVQQKKAEAIAKARDAQQRYEQEERHFGVSTGLQRAGLGLQAQSMAQADRHFNEQMKLQKDQLLLDAAKLEQSGQIAAAKAKKEEADALVKGAIGGSPVLLGYGKDGKPMIKQEPLRQDDGSLFGPLLDDVTLRKVRSQKAGTDYSVKIMDDIVRLVDENGWSSDLLKSDEWQKVQQRWGALKLNEKERVNLGAALTANEEKLLDRFLGMTDPTAMERAGDPTTGIRSARQSVLDRLNFDLTANGYTGPAYDVPEMTKTGIHERTALTPIGELSTKAVTSIPGGGAYHSGPEFPEVGKRSQAIAAQQAAAEAAVRAAPNPYGEQAVEAARGRAAREANASLPAVPDVLAKVSVSQRQALITLAATARAGNVDARAALEVAAANKDPNIAAAASAIAAAMGVPLQGLK